MECSICNEVFDAQQRRPKVLPCGHSFCLHCLDLLPKKECPADRKAFDGNAATLPDNFLVLQACERPGSVAAKTAEAAAAAAALPAPRFWCLDCKREAPAACVEEHKVCSLKKVRAKRAQPHLDALLASGETLTTILGVVAVADRMVAKFRDELQDRIDEVDALREQLQAALGAEDAQFEQARVAADNARGVVHPDAICLLGALADPMSTCSVTLEEPGGAWAWRGSVRPREDAAARLLLCRLLCDGHLERGRVVEAEDEQHEALGDDGPQQADALEVVAPMAASRWQEKTNGWEMPYGRMCREIMDSNGKGKVGLRVALLVGWSSDDGSPPGQGTVSASPKEYGSEKYVYVEWDCDPAIRKKYSAPYTEGWYSPPLRLLPVSPKVPIPEGIRQDPAKYLDAFLISCNSNAIAHSNLLASTRLNEVRAVLGLCCGVEPAWSLRTLSKVTAHLEVLGLRGADELHLRAVTAMPRLHSLFLDSVTWDTLQLAVSMPTLRRLEVHCSPDAPLVPGHGCQGLRLPRAPALEWLRVGVYPLAVALAVMRAHAATLRELELVAATDQPYGCPDLARELVDCDLRNLRRLTLLRESDIHFCRHDNVEACKRQKIGLWKELFLSGVDTSVACSTCDPGKSNPQRYLWRCCVI